MNLPIPGLMPVLAEAAPKDGPSRMDLLHEYVVIFIVSFVVAMIATPIMRRLAVANGIIDHPDEVRKAHKYPIAYLGGVAVYLGIMAGLGFSYVAPAWGLIKVHQSANFDVLPVPMAILLGLTVVMLVGLFDDVANISPWQKVGGQLLAAAALAYSDIGVKLAYQVLSPIGEALFHNKDLTFVIPFGTDIPYLGSGITIDIIYWCGTAVIAIFVLGACNASNLVDGLDGLLSGVTIIANAGLLVIALGLAVAEDGKLDSARIILCLAVMGACTGFLPHNFNPATIFLGDSGSLMLGYATITIILTLGDTGKTALVLAGLIIYGIPIVDTTLAIVRRKLARKSISEGDDQHLHHILKRALGVKGAVLCLYAMGIGFACLGVSLTMGRDRITYLLTIIFASFIGVTAIKVARRKQFEAEAAELIAKEKAAADAKNARIVGPGITPPALSSDGQSNGQSAIKPATENATGATTSDADTKTAASVRIA
ncbi:MAG: glycosyltransferase family 4 protein [Phycisphaerales bacterium]